MILDWSSGFLVVAIQNTPTETRFTEIRDFVYRFHLYRLDASWVRTVPESQLNEQAVNGIIGSWRWD